MEKQIGNKIIILAIILVVAFSSGCSSTPNPYTGIEYSISIWTEKKATLYLPLPLDLPDNSVSDLVSMIEVSIKSPDTIVTYGVIDTIHGKALRVNTTGNVVLFAKAGREYFDDKNDLPVSFIPGQTEPLYIDLSLQTNPTDKLDFTRWVYLETEDNSSFNIKVFERVELSYEPGYEGWLSLKDDSTYYYGNFTLEPGWQIIGFDHSIGYH